MDNPAGLYEKDEDAQAALNEQERMLALCITSPFPCTFWVPCDSNCPSGRQLEWECMSQKQCREVESGM